MKSALFHLFLIMNLLTLTSCEAIGDIFKAGIWIGAIGVLLIVGLIFYLFSRFRK